MITGNKTLSGNKVLITQSGTLAGSQSFVEQPQHGAAMQAVWNSVVLSGHAPPEHPHWKVWRLRFAWKQVQVRWFFSGNTGQIRFFHALCGQGRQVKQPSQLVRSAFWKAPGSRVR